MTRDTVLQLLPCYAVGDLEPVQMTEIEQWLAKDEQLAALVTTLQAQARQARDLIAADGVPEDLLDALAEPTPTAPVKPSRMTIPTASWQPIVGGIALAAAAVLLVGGWRVIAPPEVTLDATDPRLAALEQAFAHGMEPAHRLDGTAAELPELLKAAGAPAHLAVVPDLSSQGLETVGAVVLPGNPSGVGVLYRHGDDLVLRQQWDQVSALGPPTRVETMGETDVRAYEAHGVSMVVFHAEQMVCVLTAKMPLDTLMGVARGKLAPAG